MSTEQNALVRRVLTGEVWQFPKELSFLEAALEVGNQYSVAKWWSVLGDRNHEAIVCFLRAIVPFLDGRATKLAIDMKELHRRLRQNGYYDEYYAPYAAIFAIGSTARQEPNFHDIDFLLITNQIFRDMDCYDPKSAVKRDFRYDINKTINEAYRSRGRRISPDDCEPRNVITLAPKRFKDACSIHLTLQPEIRSIEDWLDADEEAKVFLYTTDVEKGNKCVSRQA